MEKDFSSKLHLNQIINELHSNKLNLIEGINNVCNRIEEVEPHIHALKWEERRRERLINEAKELEKKYPNPDDRPILYGVLIGVKDLFRVDGFPTKAGSKLPPELFDGKEASCVTKLKEAGALILGKTVTTEFAYFEPGPTRNPVNIEFTPGGSSSGSAAVVAAGVCPIALGTQTIGSITRPASFCGIIGVKPSYERIPTDGVISFSKSADHIGYFTQDISGANIISSVICNNWDETKINRTRKLPVLGIPDGKYINQAYKDTLNEFYREVDKLKSLGVKVKVIKTFDVIESINRRHRLMISAEIAQVHKKWFDEYKNLYRPHTIEIIKEGLQIKEAEIEKARDGRLVLRRKIEDLMNKNQIDAWINPSAISDAPYGISSTGSPIMNLPWTYAGLPTITIPIGKSEKKLPLGLHIATNYNNDENLLFWARNIFDLYISKK